VRKNKGFTLIELMIVVAIIAILAAIAIPNFLSFVSKTRRAEVKSNLEAIFKAELSYFGENNVFSNSFSAIRWVPVGVARYTYTAGNEYSGKSLASNPEPAIVAAGADALSFSAYGWGNIDSDPTIDTWHIRQDRVMVEDTNDLGS
jgi:type IV pilus assembly protein PilA